MQNAETFKTLERVRAHDCAHATKARQNNGITLIALIITIIVILILVAVTITVAVNGGLFENAGKAVGETQNVIDWEQQKINGIMEEYFKAPTGGTSGGSGTSGEEPEPAVVSITLDKSTITKTIPSGTTATETITATLNNASGSLTWASSNTSVAVISGSGNTRTITMKKAGTATITVSYASYSAECNITVTETSNLIEFTISSSGSSFSPEPFQAVEGMTWIEWLASDYGMSSGFSYESSTGFVYAPWKGDNSELWGVPVLGSDYLSDGKIYYVNGEGIVCDGDASTDPVNPGDVSI